MNYYLQTNMLTKRYGSKKAVNKLSIHVKRGDIYGLIGPNGAGKTTLMKMIAGFTAPTEGEINLFNDSDGQRRIGCLIESPGLYGDLNAVDNMTLKAKAMGLYNKAEIMRILEYVGLQKDLKKKTKNYSLGMKQRLGIAMALIGNPDLLILDEPINGLDPQGILEIRRLILDLSQSQNITIIISSHILEELHKVANVFGIISDGELLMEISSEELKERCSERVEICTEDTGKCVTLLEEMGIKDYNVMEKEKIFAFNCTDRVADINSVLVSKSVPVSSIGINAVTLEEFYLDTIQKGV